LIAGFILAITVYFRPSLVWVIAATAGSAVGLYLSPNLVIQGHRVVNTEKFAIVVLVLVIIVWATETANSIYTTTFFAALVAVVHSALRQKSMKSKVSNFVDTSGVTSGLKKVQDEIKRVGDEVKKVS